MKDKDSKLLEEAYKLIKEKSDDDKYLWHGSKNDFEGPVKPSQAHDVGGAAGSNMKAVYATPKKDLAIIIPMGADDADLGTIIEPGKPLQGILYGGSLRHGEKIYLYKLPKDKFEDAGTGAEEWVSTEPVMPVGKEVVNVDDYLHLIRKPTKADWEFRKKHNKEIQ